MEWLASARPEQLPPQDDRWLYWLLGGGRGSGKSRSLSEDAWWYAFTHPGERIHVIAATSADARDTVIEGESGILARAPSSIILTWNRSLGELIFVNGTKIKTFSGEEPERLRGPQAHRLYADELAAWSAPEVWDMAMFGLRLGAMPRAVIATTPRPKPLLKRIMADPRTRISHSSTFANATNLSAAALDQLRAKYEGTRLGRQELSGQMVEDIQGALWPAELIERARQQRPSEIVRVVVSVDPSGAKSASDENADLIGIVVAGKTRDGGAHVLADRSMRGSPDEWARAAVQAYEDYGADRIVAEENFGGAMVESTLRTVNPLIPYKKVRASRGKIARAEPVAALYEQGRVSHSPGLAPLEEQMGQMTAAGYAGDGSPDRVDALVWALTELAVQPGMIVRVVGGDGSRSGTDAPKPTPRSEIIPPPPPPDQGWTRVKI